MVVALPPGMGAGTQTDTNLRQMIFLARLYVAHGREGDFEQVIWNLRNAAASICQHMAGEDVDDCVRDDITDHVTHTLVSAADLTRSEAEVRAFSRLLIRRSLFRFRALKKNAYRNSIAFHEVADKMSAVGADPEVEADLEAIKLLCERLAKIDGKFELLLGRLTGLDNDDLAHARAKTNTAVKTAVSRARSELEAWLELDIELLRWQIIDGLDDRRIAARLGIDEAKVAGRRRNAWRKLLAYAGQHQRHTAIAS
jgi:DNA-directed RNA polymerase specialized sigma24 family protein